MINISYAEQDAQTAETIQQDLSQARLRLENNMLIVLATPDSIQDEAVKSDIEAAKRSGQVIAIAMLRPTPLPDAFKGTPTIDLSKKYDNAKFINFVNRADITQERKSKNRRLLYVVGGIALLMFIISLGSISAGIVAFPVDEYATENAIRDSQVATIVAPQIEVLRPRTTEDALNFQSTLDAVRNDDLIPFIVGTATAIPEQLQATNEARATQIFETESAQTQSADDN